MAGIALERLSKRFGAVAAVDRLIATLKPTPPGEKPSRARMGLEESRAKYTAAAAAAKK